MEDRQIIELYFARDEQAVDRTAEQYGGYCAAIARRITGDPRDAEECVNAVWLAAWNSIPPNHPLGLKAYLAKLTRRISLDICRKRDAHKRGGGEVALALEELQNCLPDQETPETQAEGKLLSESIQAFVCRLPEQERRAFLLRYWHLYSLEETADKMGCSKSKVNSMLFRTRVKLKNHLMKEGLF